MCIPGRKWRQRGVSLVELVVFIAVVGVSIAGVLLAIDRTARNSADPLVIKQALAIAEALLEEVQLMPFTYCDPDDPAVTTATSAASCATAEVMGPEGETRSDLIAPFDNVNDYNGFTSAGISQIDGTVIGALAAYSAAVTVTPLVFNGIPNTDALQITVTVTGPANVSVRLDGIRTRYAPAL
jgi:MSHA pilin protein MshD